MRTNRLLGMVTAGLLLLSLAARAENAGAARPDLSGHWVLNAQKSTLPQPGDRGAGRFGRGTSGDAGSGGGMPRVRGSGGGRRWPGAGGGGDAQDGDRGGQPGFGGRAGLPAEFVVELGDSDLTVSVRGLAVRRLEFGAVRPQAAPGDTVPTLAAHWQGARLVSEMESRRGGAVEESWELSPDAGELVVTTRLPAIGERPGMQIKRVYERAED